MSVAITNKTLHYINKWIIFQWNTMILLTKLGATLVNSAFYMSKSILNIFI